MFHPCLSCGACCAYFRAMFHWSETLPESFHVPEEMAENVSPHLMAFLGTSEFPPRCVALEGVIGESVKCGIHLRRASCCRDFVPSFEQGVKNERCDQARAAHGLKALSLEDWEEIGIFV